METMEDIVREVLDVYADSVGLSVILFEPSGEGYLGAAIRDPFTRAIFERFEHYSPTWRDAFAAASGLRSTTVCDFWIPGLKFIVSPIRLDGQPAGQLYAGPLLDVGGAERLYRQLVVSADTPVRSGETASAVRALRELPQDEIDGLRDSIDRLARIVCLLLDGREEGRAESAVAAESATTMTTVEAVLDQYLQMDAAFDLSGFAALTAPGVYSVIRSYGRDAHKLTNVAFKEGEGFLGQAVLSSTQLRWREIVGDSRSAQFAEQGLPPIGEIVCYPVRFGNETLGVAFGLRYAGRTGSSGPSPWESLFYPVIHAALCASILNGRLRKQMQRLQAVTEVGRFLVEADDPQRVLFTLVDASLSLVWTPTFSLLVLFGESGGKAQLVSRGLDAAHAQRYAKEVASRLRAAEAGQRSFREGAAIRSTPWGDTALECALAFNGVLVGALSVAVGGELEAGECESYVAALTMIGSAVIHATRQRSEQSGQTSEIVQLLHRMTRWRDETLYERAVKAGELLHRFLPAEDVAPREASLILHACMLAAMEPEELQPIGGHYAEIAAMLEERKELERAIASGSYRTDAYSRGAELIEAALRMADDAEMSVDHADVQVGEDVVGREETFYGRKLRSYLQKSRVVMEEFLLTDEADPQGGDTPERDAPGGGSEYNDQRGIDRLAQEAGLSKREREVLTLVVRAYSNKDIASTLYISEHTVKNHMTNIFAKLGISDRAQAMALVFSKSVE